MRKQASFAAILLVLPGAAFAADFAPALDWVKSIDRPGKSLVSAAAVDRAGSLYIAGSTTTTDAAGQSSTHVFAVKLDDNGNVLYSTAFGGSGNDTAAALAVGSDGSVYVTGSTTSADLPVTAGAYLATVPVTDGRASSYVFKLNPDGSPAWATYFAGPQSAVASIAVDAAGNPFVGGTTTGNHPVTSGAYQTAFQQSLGCNGFFCVAGYPSGFVTKFNAKGTGLIYSTYVTTDNRQNFVEVARALAVDAAGNCWIGVGVDPNIVPSGGTFATVVELNADGSAVPASAAVAGLGNVAAIGFDPNSGVYVAGSTSSGAGVFPATPGAFQAVPQPVVPALLKYQATSGGGLDAFVAKFDSGLKLAAATLLGGELPDAATSIAIDGSGRVIVAGYTDSSAFPTHALFQTRFSPRAGFVAGFDANLSNLLFSTYLGDGRPFAAQAAVPDGRGNILLAGSTLSNGNPFIAGSSGAAYTAGGLVFANRIALPAAPAVRLDSIRNYAGRTAAPLAPGEAIVVTGVGLGAGAQIVLDGSPLATVSSTDTTLVAVLPDTAKTAGAYTVQVSGGGAASNAAFVPAAPASPGIYTVDGSGTGQAYVLNSDGTPNSASNPAKPGSAITIYVTGAGQYTLNNGYAVAAEMPSVFIDNFYCNGIAAVIGPVAGLPGPVYQLSVYVPDPAVLAQNDPDLLLTNFQFPAQSPIQLVMGPVGTQGFAGSAMVSQTGVYINIAQ